MIQGVQDRMPGFQTGATGIPFGTNKQLKCRSKYNQIAFDFIPL